VNASTESDGRRGKIADSLENAVIVFVEISPTGTLRNLDSVG